MVSERFNVGDKVRLRDPRAFAMECWREAGSPDDPNAALAMDLYDARPPGPLFRVVSTQPDLDGQYLGIVGEDRAVGDGDPIGARGSDVVTEQDRA